MKPPGFADDLTGQLHRRLLPAPYPKNQPQKLPIWERCWTRLEQAFTRPELRRELFYRVPATHRHLALVPPYPVFFQHAAHKREREAHYVGVVALDPFYEERRSPLYCVASGLPDALPELNISRDL